MSKQVSCIGSATLPCQASGSSTGSHHPRGGAAISPAVVNPCSRAAGRTDGTTDSPGRSRRAASDSAIGRFFAADLLTILLASDAAQRFVLDQQRLAVRLADALLGQID